MKTAQRLEGIGEYYFSTKLREIDEMNKAGKEIINLGIGSPDLPPHPDVIRALQEETAKPANHAYQSYKGSAVLREAIASWYHRVYDVQLDAASEVLPLIGSKEGIMHICMSFLNPGDKVLIPDPGYPTYSSAVKLAGGVPVSYGLKADELGMPAFDSVSKEDLAGAKLLFVNYPHMPTGLRGNASIFEEIIRFARGNNLLVVHDNPYSFILNDHPASMLSIKDAKDVVIELNSLSKSHNMAGWRVGMLCGSAGHIESVLRFKSNMDSGMFLPVQLAAAKALSLGDEWHSELNTIYRNRRENAYALLDVLGCNYDRDQSGLFVWARVPSAFSDGYALSDEVLRKANVFITPGGIFGNNGAGHVRISLCATEEKIELATERIVSALKAN